MQFDPDNAVVKNTHDRAAKLKETKEKKAREEAEKIQREQEEKRLLNAAFRVSSISYLNTVLCSKSLTRKGT